MDRNDFPIVPTELTTVALRKESVDRNINRAAITVMDDIVALRKESVDRNSPGMSTISSITGRSPQGERG